MMKLKQLLFLAMIFSQIVYAQLDEYDDEGSSPTTTQNSSSVVLSKNQKVQFSKANIEDINNNNFPETIESFDFPNADIADIVKAVSELTGKNFIVDPGVRGKITIIAPSKITVAEAYKAFLSALAINGYAVIPSGNFLKIRSARNAQRDGIETFSGAYYPSSDQMITRIIHLKHISAEMVNRDLRILQSKDGELAPYPPTNSLIVSDYGSNIDRIMKIINQLDVPGFEDQMEVVPVKYAKAKDLAEMINKIVNKDSNQSRSGSFTSGIPRFTRSTTQTSQGSSYFMVIPDDRTNSLIVVGNRAGIDRVKKLLSQLDFKLKPEDSGGVYVYYLKFGEAEKVAQTLSGIAKDAGPRSTPSAPTAPGAPQVAPTPTEIFGGDVKITADKNTNSLVILASKPDYQTVLDLLQKIDIPRDQVYVEAIFMEMAMNDAFNWEVGTVKFNDGYGKGGFIGAKPSTLNEILNPTSGSGALLGFTDGSTVNVKVPGSNGSTTTVTMPSLISFVNFLQKNTNANILSTPQILALDNQEAEIEVGDKVVTSFTSTQPTVAGGSVTQTPQMEDATISLKIKPFISPATNAVRMEIKGTVKQISQAQTPPAFRDSTQPLSTRKISTNIVVPNGNTAVLGGLMKETELEEVSKVPLLGDIPIIGWLFRAKSISKGKTNMVVFLTPKIIRNSEDQKRVLGYKLNERIDFVKAAGGRDAFGKKISELSESTTTETPERENEPSGVE